MRTYPNTHQRVRTVSLASGRRTIGHNSIWSHVLRKTEWWGSERIYRKSEKSSDPSHTFARERTWRLVLDQYYLSSLDGQEVA